VHVRDVIEKGLGLVPGHRAPDGNYMLKYVFSGKQLEEKHRLKGGRLLAGWL
jgi:hypothetical protein